MFRQTINVVIVIVVISCCLLQQPAHSQDVRMPPTIVKEPADRERYYRTDDEISLECAAVGKPEPTCHWWKNGNPLYADSTTMPSGCSLRITELGSMHAGYYQCRATNMYGTALSSMINLQRAMIGSYQSSEPVDMRGLEQGQPHMIRCQPVKCFPQPSYTWQVIEKNGKDESPEAVETNTRVQIDERGNLHFAYLVRGDMRDNKVYKCNVLNPYLDLQIGGSYTRLHISAARLTNVAPSKAFSSKERVVGLEGGIVVLHCFFYGYPIPTLTWRRSDGVSMPYERLEYRNQKAELEIKNVVKSDEADYVCEARNTKGSDRVVMRIDVEWEPKFLSDADKLHSVNVTQGDQLRMPCRVTAEPVADIVWLRNGTLLDSNNMPPRMRIIDNELILDDACKNCDDRETDLQVIQCNASNVHGYQFIDAYINVLQRTKMTEIPVSVHLPFDETFAEFRSAATGDDSTPVTIRWYRLDQHSRRTQVVNRTGQVNVTVSEDGTTLSFFVTANDTAGWDLLTGSYQCEATNGYSREVANFGVTIDPPPTPPDSSTPVAAPVGTGGFMDYWWVLVLLIVLLLLIILIIICCLWCCNNAKGDTYYVDKKEKKDNKDPEKELSDSAIQPYRRPDTDPLKPGTGSLAEPIEGDSDEDEESLNEYGDIDAGKFNEEGSFIGDYRSEQRNRGYPPDSYA